ncbi:hypothetical protein MMC27_004686 [Xylographa pallens]|nr:hypothetical protein [Xylographa pallens]
MEGYTKLGAYMGSLPRCAIFRRFGALGMQNLLYLQAELVDLELQFQKCSRENRQSEDPEKAYFDTDWYTLAQHNDGNEMQWILALRIREKLKEYGDALIQQSLLCQLKRPVARDLKALKGWMRRPTQGRVRLVGSDSNLWENSDPRDVVTVDHSETAGPFSSWVANVLVWKYHALIGHYFKKPNPAESEYCANTVHYSQKGILKVATLVAMSFSSILPVAAISALYCVESMPIRIVMVAAFTVCFTICLGLLTDAKSVDIFAATTAFAAVQVVFIGTTGSST